MKKSKKKVLKGLYILLVVLCLLCIGALVFLLAKEEKTLRGDEKSETKRRRCASRRVPVAEEKNREGGKSRLVARSRKNL